MYDLWNLCADGKQVSAKVAVWKINFGALNFARRVGHSAFRMAAPLSVLGALRSACSAVSGDLDHVAIKYMKPVDEWIDDQRRKITEKRVMGEVADG